MRLAQLDESISDKIEMYVNRRNLFIKSHEYTNYLNHTLDYFQNYCYRDDNITFFSLDFSGVGRGYGYTKDVFELIFENIFTYVDLNDAFAHVLKTLFNNKETKEFCQNKKLAEGLYSISDDIFDNCKSYESVLFVGWRYPDADDFNAVFVRWGDLSDE